jgi:glycerol-3-phosphate responsive antiterminator
LIIKKISTGTIDIRNKVIHGGYFPTREEVVQAIKDAKLVIREHNVQIFSDKTP